MAYAYDASLLERVKPRISQWEATTGRRITPSMLDALIKGELDAEVGKAQQSRALDLQERGIANAESAQKDAASAAKVKGITDIASTAGMGYLAYKSVTKPSAMSELIAYKKGLGTTAGTSPAVGAQATLAGGAPAVGAQTTLAGGEAGSLAAYDSALAAGAAEGVGSTAGTTAASTLSTVAPYASAAGVALVGRPVGKLVSKALGTHEKTTTDITEAAAYAGAGFLVGGPVGAVVGGVIGAAKGIADSVICGELLRQGWITEKDRTNCVVFRFRHISDPMFHAYMEWAAPIVAIMKREGVGNALLLPFARAFVGYMIFRKPTFFQRMVWKYAWWKCTRIAYKHGAMVAQKAA